MINEKFVVIGALLQLIGIVDYIWATLKGTTKPNRVSWSLWALAPLVAFGGQLSEGVGLLSLLAFTLGFGPVLVLLASFLNKKAYWKLGSFDYICGALSLIGLSLWLATGKGNYAIIFAIAADAIAYLPTYAKSFKAPESESYLVFLLSSFNAAITILTIKNWDFATAVFPIYIFIVNIPLVLLIKFRLGKSLKNA